MQNPVIFAISGGKATAEDYLSHTEAEDFIAHITDLLQSSVDQIIVQNTIDSLQKLIKT